MATNISFEFHQFLFSSRTRPRLKKRRGRRREKFHHRHPVTRIAGRWNDQADTFWSLHCYLLSDITISLWLMQTFAQIAGNVLSSPPRPSSPLRRSDERAPVHTCARRCNERVCNCVCHDYTRSSSVCNCSPFVPRSGGEAKSGVGTWFHVNFVNQGRGNKNAARGIYYRDFWRR